MDMGQFDWGDGSNTDELLIELHNQTSIGLAVQHSVFVFLFDESHLAMSSSRPQRFP